MKKATYNELNIYIQSLSLLSEQKLPLVFEINKNINNINEVVKTINKDIEDIREKFYDVDFEQAKEKQKDKKIPVQDQIKPSFQKYVFDRVADPNRKGQFKNVVVRDANKQPLKYKKGDQVLNSQTISPMVPDDKIEDFRFETNKIFKDENGEDRKFEFEVKEILEEKIEEYAEVKFAKTGEAFDSRIIAPLLGIIIVKEFTE